MVNMPSSSLFMIRQIPEQFLPVQYMPTSGPRNTSRRRRLGWRTLSDDVTRTIVFRGIPEG